MKTLETATLSCGILLGFILLTPRLVWADSPPSPAPVAVPADSTNQPAKPPPSTHDRHQKPSADQPPGKFPQPRVVSQTVLTIQGTRFAINGQPAFLYGISYYGALGAPETAIRKDLKEMRRRGFNWLRVWANWAAFDNDVSAVDAEGNPREVFLEKLKWLVAECDRRRLVVDVTLTRGDGVAGPPRLQSLDAHWRAIETITTALYSYRNWYWDLGNERNIHDARYISINDLRTLRQRLRKLDPKRLATASHAGDLTESDLRAYLRAVRVDFIAPHRPRNGASPGQTEARTQAYLLAMKQIGRLLPVHYQEPFRRGFGKWNPQAGDYAGDARAAKAGAAAGWCFHNGDERRGPEGRPRRSFDLRDDGLFEQLDPEELKALTALQKLMRERKLE